MHRPTFGEPLLPGFLVAFLRFAKPVVDIGDVSAAFDFNCDRVSMMAVIHLLTNDNVRISGKRDEEGSFGGALHLDQAIFNGYCGMRNNLSNYLKKQYYTLVSTLIICAAT